MSEPTTVVSVHVEFQRVQTWLFGVPRLRAMIGSNTLLGEVLRVELPKLARDTSRWSLSACTGHFPTSDDHDPLAMHDDPSTDAADGVLSRDGGHFEAEFTRNADAFCEAAAQLIRTQLPGLRFRISLDGKPVTRGQSQLSTELPVLAPCEWTGRGLATDVVDQGVDTFGVSEDVKRRHEAALRAEAGGAFDIASLLSARSKLKGLQRPREFEDLVGDGYLALIHADGNGVGGGSGKDASGRATHFHRNRVLLRRAVHAAVNAHCPESGKAPLILLMLGGDDLLLVCQAKIALPFVATLCQVLDEIQPDTGPAKLTLGIGVAIAKCSVPIYRLHQVSEQLVASAKRRVRGFGADQRKASIVDWAVYSTSWVDDPEDVRRRDWVRGTGSERRVLSRRPMKVLGEGLDSLQGLLKGVEKLNKAQAPRSQLRFLIDQLPRGRVLAELAFEELASAAKGPLQAAGLTKPWEPAEAEGTWVSALLDLVEAYEIERLGSGDRGEQKLEAIHE